MVENRAGGTEGAEAGGAEQAQEGTEAASPRRGGRKSVAGAAGAAAGTGAKRGTRGSKAADTAEAGGAKRTRRGTAAAGEAASGGESKATAKRGTRAAKSKSAAGGTPATGGGRGRKAASSGPNLRQDLRDFVGAHSQGWNHQDWLNLVNALGDRGHDVSDRDQLGRDLERERLTMRIEAVDGVGEQEAQAVAERFGTLWSLRQASAAEIAEAAGIDRSTADKIQQQVR